MKRWPGRRYVRACVLRNKPMSKAAWTRLQHAARMESVGAGPGMTRVRVTDLQQLLASYERTGVLLPGETIAPMKGGHR